MLSSLIHDTRHSLRQLIRAPSFAMAAILTLGLGIGATTAIFSAINGLLLRDPGGIAAFDRIVSIYTSDYSGPPYGASSLPDVSDFGREAGAFAGVGAYTMQPLVLGDEGGGGPAEMVLGQVVTPNYFDLLGTRPAAGSLYLGDGDAGLESDVVVLSHEFWMRRFGGDPGVIGEPVRIGGVELAVAGVTEAGFRGLMPALAPPLFVPTTSTAAANQNMEARGSRGYFTFGRLTDGATIGQAETQLRSVAAGLYERYPDAWTDIRDRPRAVTLLPASETTVPPQLRTPALGFAAVVLTIAGGVLLVGCANLANLLLARATRRRREIGIRMAIGARRRRIARQLLTESLVLAAFGALLGVAIAWGGTRALALATTGLPLPFTVEVDIQPDVRVFAFAAAVSLFAGLITGLAPALLGTRGSLSSSLHREEGGARRLGIRGFLAAGQIAVAMAVLTAGGLLLRSLLAAQAIDPGFRADGLVSVNVAVDETSTTPEGRLVFQREVAERIGALPGVSVASYASSLPLGAGSGRRGVRPEGYTAATGEDMEVNSADAGPDYFRAMGIEMLRGRDFAPGDRLESPQVAIINEAFAQRYFSGQDPIGKRIGAGPEDLMVIGVARDGKYVSLGEAPLPFFWRAADQWPPAMLSLVARGAADPAALAGPIRSIVAEVDPDAAVTGVASASQHLSFALLPQRIGSWLLGLMGALGLVLAAVGIYGVMAYAVGQRTREFGIRLALGARPADLTKMVIRQGMVVCLIGGAVGLGLAAVTTRLMTSLLFGTDPLDPTTFVGVAAVVFSVALVANWLPARRTGRADPLEALRFD